MEFGITFDYLCPFSRNASEAVLNGMDAGKTWRPRFLAFSLSQVHTADDDPDVWDEPAGKSGVLAFQWGLAVRDHYPEQFPAVHRALYAARFDQGRDINDEAVVRDAAAGAGADVEAVATLVASGTPLETLAVEHMECVAGWEVFGVPTFIVDDHATFIRFMSRGDVADLERALGLLTWTNLNEFKRTTIPR